MVLAYVRVEVPEETVARARTVRELSQVFSNYVVRNLAPRTYVQFYVYGSSLADVEERVASARKVPGAGAITCRPLTRILANPRFGEWRARVLERRVRSPGNGPRRP
jgi:hypothetical protein